jgi:hypothetical protein
VAFKPTGKWIAEALEHGVAGIEAEKGCFPPHSIQPVLFFRSPCPGDLPVLSSLIDPRPNENGPQLKQVLFSNPGKAPLTQFLKKFF